MGFIHGRPDDYEGPDAGMHDTEIDYYDDDVATSTCGMSEANEPNPSPTTVNNKSET